MTLAPGTSLGPYEIVGSIGAGGMGEVYRAKDTRLGRDVAVKVLPTGITEDAHRLRRFELEAKTLAALSHPNVLAVYDVGHHEGSPYLVMELLEGETLRERLASGALPLSRAVELTLQIAHGLAAAHAKGLVHRDLKPANLFITMDGHLKILDFGLAKQATPPGDLSQLPTRDARSLTSEGFALGTPGYMSPEQVEGKPADARSDLFAVGVVFYEMLSGRRAFERNSIIETLSATLKEDPPELASPLGPMPASLQRLVARCLEKEPGSRYQRAQDLVQDLESALSEPSASGSHSGRWAWRFGRQSRSRTLLASALILLASGGGVLLWGLRRGPLPPAGLPGLVALPSKVLGSQEAAFLTDAIPDTLSTLLVGVEGLDMKVPPSSAQVEKVRGDLAKVAEAYRVEQVVLTTVTVQGESLILNVKLADAATQKVHWAGQFEGTRATYNTLVREAALALARALKPGTALDLGAGTNSEFELALKEGKHYSDRFGDFYQIQDFERAKGAFERALGLDPASARAMGHFATLWMMRAWGGPEYERTSNAEAERLARLALTLDPQAAVWGTLAQVEGSKRPASMERVLEYAIRSASPKSREPDHGAALGGAAGGPILMAAGGCRIFDRNPLAIADGAMGATGLTWQGHPETALPLLDRGLRIEPGHRFCLVAKSEALVALGRLDEAGQFLKRCEPKDTDRVWDAEFWRQVRFKLAVAQGDMATATVFANRAAKLWLAPQNKELDLNAVWTMPPGLMRIGRREEALRMLEKAMVAFPNAEGWLGVLYHPELRPAHGDPRFQRLIAQGKKDVTLALRIFQEARERGDLPAFLEAPMTQLQELLNRTP
ncbi:MAG: serine/threonine protein kinase [Holophagaceae bacterium]|uniref:non-specific serine/threonine protein kinase n=1 Tax=Candidatus Geothrix skivensis TaxID=2954439 RepID=A0A9D7XKQ0_9BACT|nr:serine/threonine protein kinase [Candidatus Geothrix skivensis]